MGWEQVNCPTLAGFVDEFTWRGEVNSSAALTITLVPELPADGLRPGVYRVREPIYLLDSYNQRGAQFARMADGVELVVSSYGCSLTAPTAVPLDLTSSAGGLTVQVSCSDGTSGAGKLEFPADIALSLTASGTSRAEFNPAEPQRLPVGGSGGNGFILADWESLPDENCRSGNAFWDGRDGPNIGRITPGAQNVTMNKTLFFRLCGGDKLAPGDYTAQAILSVVQR
ncbi:hypothetical protein RJE46_25030 (plasmid) [Cedecea neteri]|uniref:hypothetical protein n=1 Tax=Cedecea neteri TaxID=158822 RepID=UPI002893744C|nr:hypothetical protein [Cedecea neteri]WNJ82204.1 hypothetical protein RJE46_25030 [Cedecea neteri]